jgi:hypothetical protein
MELQGAPVADEEGASRRARPIIAVALEITGLPSAVSSISNTGNVGIPVPLRNTASASSLSTMRANV